jgi:hypothetical protein
VSRVLQVAGLLGPTMVSDNFLGWGDAGTGPITVAVRPGTGKSGHVYLVLNGRGWGTGSATGGPGWLSYGIRPGFVTRVPTGMAGPIGAGLFKLIMQPPTTGLSAVPGALADSALRAYTTGIQNNVNRAIGAGGFQFGGWFGEGGQLEVKRPTLIGVGEKGREQVSVTPGAAHRAGPVFNFHGGITITNNQPGDIREQMRREIARALDEIAVELEHQPTWDGQRALY